jgi:hypothetical protein
MHRLILLTVVFLSLIALRPAHSAVLINLTGAQVFNSDGTTPVSDGRLMYAVALPTGSFTEVTTSGWTAGDNIQLGSLWLTDDNVELGGFSSSLNFDLSGGVLAGQQFGILWFTSLSSQAGNPSFGSSYGFYTSPTWLIPADGNFDSFAFETVSVGGSIPNSAGAASLVVIPEPGTWALIIVALTALIAFRRRIEA